jgi:hypothetical protein
MVVGQTGIADRTGGRHQDLTRPELSEVAPLTGIFFGPRRRALRYQAASHSAEEIAADASKFDGGRLGE